MNIMESIRVALEAVRANLLRSALTTLGIVIGIAAVIAVVAIGQGGQSMVMNEMEKIGSNLFAVYYNWQSDQPRTGKEFNYQDINAIKEQVPEINNLTPISNAYRNIRGGQKDKNVQVVGVNSDYPSLRNLELIEGRFFNEQDNHTRRKVAAIDESLAKEFFGNDTPIGQRIVIGGNSITVIGVVKESASIFTMGEAQKAYIPIRVWLDIHPSNFIHSFEGSTYNREDVHSAMQKTVTILERRNKSEGMYMNISMEQQMQTAGQITGILTMVVGSIAGISLLVGGIGVMNIMLVSVTERTREIGLRMALGARRKDILLQFLIEAVVLCIIGGIIGMSLGIAGAFLIAKVANWPPLVSWTTVILAFIFSTIIGIVFGLLPANKASRLDPIEALRRD